MITHRKEPSNLDNIIWTLAILEPTELHVTHLTYSYQIDIDTNFKLIELKNSCQAYNPNLILPSSLQMMEEKHVSVIKQRFFNYDAEYMAIPNLFFIQTFNISHLAQEELNSIANNLSSIDRISIHNVTNFVKPIDKNYPFIYPTIGYVLLTIGDTITVILIIGILYYAKYRWAEAVSGILKLLRKKQRKPPSARDIEVQMHTLTSTNDHVITNENDPTISTKVTSLLLQRKLKKDFGVDFTPYEKHKKKKEQRLQIGSDQWDSGHVNHELVTVPGHENIVNRNILHMPYYYV